MPDHRITWGDTPGLSGPGGLGQTVPVDGTAFVIQSRDTTDRSDPLDPADTGAAASGDINLTVTVTDDSMSAAAQAFTLGFATFDDATDDLPPDSQLKLIGPTEGAGVTDTITTTFEFSAAGGGGIFGGGVTDLQFRIDDIDNGLFNDVDVTGTVAGDRHSDIVTVRAFGADGVTEIPVTISAAAGYTVTTTGTSSTATANPDVQNLPTSGDNSALISVTGPVTRIEIDYDNGDIGEQEVLISDLVFTTADPVPAAPPVAVADVATTPMDTLLTGIDVLSNDSDPNFDPLTVVAASTADGSVTINGDGTLDFTPTMGFVGVATIQYTISDGDAGTSDTISFVTVTVTNDAPTAVNDTAATDIDTASAPIDVLGNDTDPEGDTLTVTAAAAMDGTVAINGDGTLTYTPDLGFTGTDTITYTIVDPFGGTDTADVTVTVTDPLLNAAPIGVNDQINASTGFTSSGIDILANDSDPDGDPLTVISAIADSGATVTINGDGTLDYTPTPGFTGTDQIRYVIEDPLGASDTAIVRVSVRDDGGPNQPPVATNDFIGTTVDTPLTSIDILSNDTDPEGDGLTVTLASSPNGTVTINGDGTLDYTPNLAFAGIDTITYTIDDGNGNTVTADVIVSVSPPGNTAPTVVGETDTTIEDTPTTVVVLTNDSDPDGDPISVISATAPNGTVVINGDNSLTYTPDPGYTGLDPITYLVSDGFATSPGIVTVTVTPDPNQAPDAVPDTVTTTAGTPVLIFAQGNDSDPDGDPIMFDPANPPSVDPLQGTVAIGGGGDTLFFTPAAGFDDDVATITYTIIDPSGETDTTTVQVIVGTPPLDGVVEGTPGAEYIGVDDPTTGPVDPYLGDPDGDQVDNDDAITPGAGSDDDSIDAGDGNDTIDSGDGDDSVQGDEGDDVIDSGDGDDTVEGGDGDDSIETGDGDDSVSADDPGAPGFGNDTVTTGDGNDTVGTGLGDDVIDTSGSTPAIDEITFPSIPFDFIPADDRDFVDADEGNDTITTGDDDDTVIGGEGDDVIDTGIDDDSITGDGGDDTITAGQGNDYVEGGDDDDVITTGTNAPYTDYIGDDPNLPLTDSGITYVTDPNTADDRDTVFGGDGNDSISTGDDADSIDGGNDDDTIDGGIDDDTIRGGRGNDSILGGHGSDTIDGGNDNDYIDAGHTSTTTLFEDEPDATEPAGLELNDRDVVTGGSGHDTILGGDDDDSLSGGSGVDSISGGIDDDTIDGGTGNDILEGDEGDDSILGDAGSDVITGGAGADTIFGGTDADTILGATTDDVIDGGQGPDPLDSEIDVLDLRGAGTLENAGGRITITYTSLDEEDGIIEFRDATDAIVSTATFTEIETVIPCFTPGTMIATPTGERPVEDLKVGDRVITRDNGIQEIRWAGAKALTGAQLAHANHLQPVLIRAGALGDNLPEKDILVSPQHRMLLNTDKAAMYFEEREVLVAAKHLTFLEGVDIVESSGTTYIHIMFNQHEVVLSNGAWSESFQPGDHSLDGIGEEQRQEILELFPELAEQTGVDAYASARRALKRHEAQLLLG